MANGKDPATSKGISLRQSTQTMLAYMADYKMTSMSAYTEMALWEKFSRDLMTEPNIGVDP